MATPAALEIENVADHLAENIPAPNRSLPIP